MDKNIIERINNLYDEHIKGVFQLLGREPQTIANEIVEEGGKYIVRYEDALTTPAWDRAGINGYYWIHKAEF